MTLDSLTEAKIRALSAGPELDGLVDDVLGVERRAVQPYDFPMALWSALLENPVTGVWVYEFGGERWTVTFDRQEHEARKASTGQDSYEAGWAWEQRIGKPWQASMEAHVAAWRKPPSRAWSTDRGAAMELLEEMYRRTGFAQVGAADLGVWRAIFGWRYGECAGKSADAPTAPHAVAIAACLAVKKKG